MNTTTLLAQSSDIPGIFSVPHIIFLAVLLPATIALAIFVSKKFGWHKRVLYIACALAIISELTKVLYLVDEFPNGFYLRPEHLPFNLCSIQIIFIFFITFSNNDKIKNPLMAFMYPTMLGGGLMALLIPTSSVDHGWFTPISFQFWIFHAMLIFLALYMIITKPIKFSIKSYFTALVMIAGAFIFAIYINSILGYSTTDVNFFFVARPPMENLPILNLDHGWFAYVGHLAWLAILLISLCYIPTFVTTIRDRRKKKREVPAISDTENTEVV